MNNFGSATLFFSVRWVAVIILLSELQYVYSKVSCSKYNVKWVAVCLHFTVRWVAVSILLIELQYVYIKVSCIVFFSKVTCSTVCSGTGTGILLSEMQYVYSKLSCSMIKNWIFVQEGIFLMLNFPVFYSWFWQQYLIFIWNMQDCVTFYTL